MEGPTPSSAIFYGALSVHLGAFLLLRVSPSLEISVALSTTVIFLGLASALFGAMAARVQSASRRSTMAVVGICLLSLAALLRSGIVPAHCWITDLFEFAGFGSSLLFVPPLIGAYAVMRLVLPIAPTWTRWTRCADA